MIEPLNGNVVVRPDALPEQTQAGLHLVTAEREQPVSGTVVAVCDDSPVVKGDTVLYRKYAGTEVKVEGEALLVLNPADLLCRIAAAA